MSRTSTWRKINRLIQQEVDNYGDTSSSNDSILSNDCPLVNEYLSPSASFANGSPEDFDDGNSSSGEDTMLIPLENTSTK